MAEEVTFEVLSTEIRPTHQNGRGLTAFVRIRAACPKCAAEFWARRSPRYAVAGTFHELPLGEIQLSCPTDRCFFSGYISRQAATAAPSVMV